MKTFILSIFLLILLNLSLFSEKQLPELTFSAEIPTFNTHIVAFNNNLWFIQPENGIIMNINSRKTYTVPISSDCLYYPESKKVYYLKKGKFYKGTLKKKFKSYPVKLKKSYYSAKKYGDNNILLVNYEDFTTSVYSIKKNKILMESRLSDLSYPLTNDLYADIIISDFNKLAVINIYDSGKKFISELSCFQYTDKFISKVSVLDVDEDFRISIILIGKGISKISLIGQNGELLQETPISLPVGKLICYCYSNENKTFYYLLFDDGKYLLYKKESLL